jgi:5-methyltetrahydropteroyltriglutamate--homocysteine methyltransferase
VFTATAGLVLPTTVTGSWPRPTWFTESLRGRSFSEGMLDPVYREQFVDAVAAVVSDQRRAGLDILTNGDYHLDASFAGLSWELYPVERLSGVDARRALPSSHEWPHPPGTLLGEVVGAWRWPPVVDRIGEGTPLELDKIWRVAQALADRPVKLGTVSTQLVASALELATDYYAPDKRDLMWDMATVMNRELRRLADAGCRVIQIEEPLIHLVASTSSDREYIDFLVDCLNHELRGLDDVEVWVHTCWGNASMQRVFEDGRLEQVVEIFLERVAGDVWTIETKDTGYRDLRLLAPYRGRMRKKVAIGAVSHRRLQVETPEEVAADIRAALDHVELENLIVSSDCGFGRGGSTRLVAFYKAAALAQGANIVRRELGLPERPVPAAEPGLQFDVPAGSRSLAFDPVREP